MDFSLSRYDGLRERCAPIQAKLRDFPFNQLLQILAAAPKSRLSGLTSSGLQACGVGFRWTRRTCFLRSFDLTFLVPPFSAFRSLASGCRLIAFGTAAEGNASGTCVSLASGSAELT